MTVVSNIVEQDKSRARVIERNIADAERLLPSVKRVSVRRAVKVHIVIAGAVIPRDACGARQCQMVVEQREVITHHVTMMDGKCWLRYSNAMAEFSTHVIQFLRVRGLRIGRQ